MLDRIQDSLLRTFGSLDAVPGECRGLFEELDRALGEAEQDRLRLSQALERTSTELHELLVELDALRRARTAAESTNLVRGEILATVSRTMRTPTDAIVGLTGLLRLGALLPTQRAYVEAVHGAAEALRTILNSVSDFSRLESGTLPLEPIPFDLRVMVEDLATAQSAQAQAKGLSLRLAWRPDAPRRVTGDPGRVRQILAALLGDAFGRLERGEIVLEVGRGGMRSGGGGVRFTVEDTGPSIPDDLLPTLFEPFTRSDAYPSRDGGLALPIARHLSHLMGGDLVVENLPGAGSRFTARLPLPVEEGVQRRASGAYAAIPTATTLSAYATMMVVDADPGQRAGWASIAEAAGFRAAGFGSRDEAMAELRRYAEAGQPVSVVVFSDHDAEGYDRVGREIVNQDALGHPALIMLPAVGHPGDARRLHDAGFRSYLVKPVAPADFREALETLRRAPRETWHELFLTRHALAEARQEELPTDSEVDASLAEVMPG